MLQIFEIPTNNSTFYSFTVNFRQQKSTFDQQNVSKPDSIRNIKQQSTNTNHHKQIAMKTLIVLAVAIVSCVGLRAQSLQGSQPVTYFYTVNFDDNMVSIFNSTDSTSNIPTTSFDNGKFLASLVDTFYCIAAKKFKTELGLELLPLNELQGKVKYSSAYPECPNLPNIKKAVKTAAGYKYYVDYYVNVFSDLSPESTLEPSAKRIRPLYAISFTIYNRDGKPVKEVKLSYKSRQPLACEKEEMSAPSCQMKAKLCDFYNEALNELTEVYKTDYSNPI